jgi:hypothetical protein
MKTLLFMTVAAALACTALAVSLADALDTISAANGGASLRQLAELSECLGR